MAEEQKYRVTRPKRYAGYLTRAGSCLPSVGYEFDWDGETVDDDGEIVIEENDVLCYTLPSGVEKVGDFAQGDRVRLLPGAKDNSGDPLTEYDANLVDGAVVTVTDPSGHLPEVGVKADEPASGTWFVLPEYLEKVEDAPAPKAEVIETEREVVTKTVEKTVVLRLTEAEAQLVADVFHRVGGARYPERSAVIRGLQSVGFAGRDAADGTIVAYA